MRAAPRIRAAAITAVIAAGAALTGCAGGTPHVHDQRPLPPAQPVAQTPEARAAQAASEAQTAQATSNAQAEQAAMRDQGTRGGAQTEDYQDAGTNVAASTASSHAARARHILSAADRASFTRLQRRLGGRVGLAVSGLGLNRTVQHAGSLSSAVAWSTSKAPVAMAVIDAGLGSAQRANLTAAITESDNQAAEALWAALGGGESAAQAADQQLRAAGDQQTVIQPRVLRAGYTAFGQTAWRLTDQARFAAGMSCTSAGSQVLSLMGQVVPGQRWGLGSAGVSVKLKGGWGPGTDPGVAGAWLDRQMGVLSVHGRPLAVAIASSGGSHASATSALTQIARWLVSHADMRGLPTTPRC